MSIASFLESPVGTLSLVERGGRLCALMFEDQEPSLATLGERLGFAIERGTVSSAPAVSAYFSGELDALDAIEVDADGSEFQRRVWAELRRIPRGKTASYMEIARAIGQPSAVRAVGAANGQNPIAVVVPCHRVIGADGSLTGYGGGLPRKRWLLEHEGAIARELFARP